MGKRGFRYLLKNGVVYVDAHHAHANTETIVGHATLTTGAHPAAHRMIGNAWFDRKMDRIVYNIEDSDFPIVIAGAGVDKSDEINPKQRVANTDGRSPLTIMSKTFSDELAIHYGPSSKIIAVSVKDRGAVSSCLLLALECRRRKSLTRSTTESASPSEFYVAQGSY